MTIGDKIRAQRKAMNLTQGELGEKLGVKTNAVSKWECGRVEDIPTSKIKAMAALFGVRPSYLIDDSDPEEKETPAQEPDGWEQEAIRLLRALPEEDFLRELAYLRERASGKDT